MLSPNDNAAIGMLRNAGIEPTTEEVTVLSDDILYVMDELDNSDDEYALCLQAETLLLQRIGGKKNLRSYVDVLLAGARRKKAL